MAHTTSPNYVDLGDMRKKYKENNEAFLEEHLNAKEPIAQFQVWFEDACKHAGIYEANAMLLSTASKEGVPSCRPVLLKGFSEEGFTFYTNYKSRKAQDLDENPKAALTFFWNTLQRVIRIEGTAEKLPMAMAEKYFHSRPRESQIGAAVSIQSEVIPGRHILVERAKALQVKHPEGTEIPHPEFWGGYIIKPHSVEFWQGQSDRLHDRIRFRLRNPNEEIDPETVHIGEGNWVYERLSP